jgi:ABC-2 type transport system ATP-binding protein/lipopolysaccharide transport system ATP-binding protein
VTHSLGLIKEMCDQAVWLEHGQIRALGPSSDVVDQYLEDVNDREVHAQHPTPGPDLTVPITGRRGTGEIRVTSLEYLDRDGRPNPLLLAGAPCTFRLRFSAREDVPHAWFGMGFLNESNLTVAEPNSRRVESWSVDRGDGYVDLVVDELLLQPGTYRVSVGISDRGHVFDFVDREYDLHVRGRGDQEAGLTRMPGIWRPPVLIAPGSAEVIAAEETAGAQ